MYGSMALPNTKRDGALIQMWGTDSEHSETTNADMKAPQTAVYRCITAHDIEWLHEQSSQPTSEGSHPTRMLSVDQSKCYLGKCI